MAVSGATTSYSNAVDLVEERKPELFVLGTTGLTGEGDALACLRNVRLRHRDIKAIVISDDDSSSSIAEAFAAGAVAVVTRTATADDLAVAVRQAFDRSTIYLANQPARDIAPQGHPLTRREDEILKLVSSGRSNSDVARLLWITEQTVKFHLSNIYRKLGVANRTQAARRQLQLRRPALEDDPMELAPPASEPQAGRESERRRG
jgi:DNA-binding NarL/FixJ family response regulator